jgi:exopolysaccharide biosynthesis polyprenyl glycosylphosphotransferase
VTVDHDWSTAASSAYGYQVPRRFLWLSDLLTQIIALFVAHSLAPVLQSRISLAIPARLPWLAWIQPPSPSVPWFGVFHPLSDVLWIPLVMIPVTLLSMQLVGGYGALLQQSRTRVVLSSVVAPLVGLSAVTLLLVAVRIQETSRGFIFSLALLTMIAFLGYRSALRAYKNRRLRAGHYVRNVVIVASSDHAERVSTYFTTHVSKHLYRLYGYLAADIRAAARRTDVEVDRQPRELGTAGDLGNLLVHHPIHEVIAVQSDGSESWLKNVTEQCDYFRVTLRVVPEILMDWRPRDLEYMFRDRTVALPAIVLKPRHFDDDALFAKRVLDIIVSATLLAVLSPGFLLIAVAIKLATPGLPVFYPWRVIGYKGRPFTGYKFTTMQADADERKADLMHLNEMTGPVFKIKNDPRITPLGRFLRKYSLNELPQLWSVLKGDMSLVGPRPAWPHELARYELWQKRKLCVQPGITCLWQIRGRNKISNFDDWVRMDFEYIDNWSLWLDCRILIRTGLAIIGGSGS